MEAEEAETAAKTLSSAVEAENLKECWGWSPEKSPERETTSPEISGDVQVSRFRRGSSVLHTCVFAVCVCVKS
jgi:hypothetical protein